MTNEIRTGTNLEPLSEERFAALACRSLEIAKLSALKSRTRFDVEAAAIRAGVSAATVYRDLQKSRGEGPPTISDLGCRKGGFPKGRSRLHPHVEAVIAEALTSHYLTPSKPPLTDMPHQTLANQRSLLASKHYLLAASRGWRRIVTASYSSKSHPQLMKSGST